MAIQVKGTYWIAMAILSLSIGSLLIYPSYPQSKLSRAPVGVKLVGVKRLERRARLLLSVFMGRMRPTFKFDHGDI